MSNEPLESNTQDQVAIEIWRLPSRLYLFWTLLEDAVRQEVNYSSSVATYWHQMIKDVRIDFSPLLKQLEAKSSEPSRSATAVRRTCDALRNAEHFSFESPASPVLTIFTILMHLRDGRSLLRIVLRDLCEHQTAVLWSAEGNTGASEDAKRRLSHALEAFGTACDSVDEAAQCNWSRQVFLSLYLVAALDESIAKPYYVPVLDRHCQLMSKMVPGIRRECVRHRLSILESIPTDRFEVEAIHLTEDLLTARGWSAACHK